MNALLPMPDSLFDDAEFAPAAWPNPRGTADADRRGGNRPTHPDAGHGVAVRAAVQVNTSRRLAPDGAVVTDTTYDVRLRVDPTGLNGGAGVREGDAFRWGGLFLVAQGPALSPSAPNGTWSVACLDER